VGSNRRDYLIGLEGSDTLNGKVGADTMDGGNGDDRYYVDNARDVIKEAAGGGHDVVYTSRSYTLAAGAEVEELRANTKAAINLAGNEFDNSIYGSRNNNVLSGGGGDDSLFGQGGHDVLKGGIGDDALDGGAGNDKLFGGPGNDQLTGGSGRDSFMFNSLDGVDTITDFAVPADTISLARNVFDAFTKNGFVAKSQFTIGTEATTTAQHIVYDSGTGALYYDADGNGAEAQQQIAQLSTGLVLTNKDFFIF
jgi:Ca2+-binding RTX toxin-like protein